MLLLLLLKGFSEISYQSICKLWVPTPTLSVKRCIPNCIIPLLLTSFSIQTFEFYCLVFIWHIGLVNHFTMINLFKENTDGYFGIQIMSYTDIYFKYV